MIITLRCCGFRGLGVHELHRTVEFNADTLLRHVETELASEVDHGITVFFQSCFVAEGRHNDDGFDDQAVFFADVSTLAGYGGRTTKQPGQLFQRPTNPLLLPFGGIGVGIDGPRNVYLDLPIEHGQVPVQKG